MTVPTNRSAKGRPQANAAGGGAFFPTLIVLFALLFAITIFANFWTELKWFEQIEAARVFWTQYGASIALGVVGVVLVGAVVALNMAIAMGRKRDVTTYQTLDNPGEHYVDQLRQKKWLSYGVIPLAAGLLFGASFSSNWRTFLLWFNGTPFGKKDPEYGLDISFYVFALPAIQGLMAFATILLILSLLTAGIVYWLKQDISVGEKLKVSKKAQLHLGILIALGAFGFAINFWLARYQLLLGNNQKFSGATFTDINASKPGLTILAISIALIAVLFVVAAVRRRWKPAVIGIAAAMVTGVVVNGIYPALMQSFKVNPNAAELESTFIQRNIDATLTAYGLEDVDKKQYDARTDVAPGQLRKDSETTAQIRLLDPNIVDPSFNQLQQNRQYYQFLEPLTVDRYEMDGKLRDTVIAVRELNLGGLDGERRTWVNDHTVYTHGFGVAAAYGNTVTPKGNPEFWEGGIPSTGEIGEYEPRVYFGQRSPIYSIVGAPEGTEPWELDYPDDAAPNGQVNTTYTGDGGPSIGNSFSKLMFAIKFRSTDLFFSDRVTSESQILFDRDPHKRVAKVAPYLTLDSKVIPAVVDMDDNPETPKELVWIIDAYTTSNNYPYSARETLTEATTDFRTTGGMVANAPEEINYIRNSVKAVVNAYDGSVTLYQWDQKDPIINAWKGIFPGQITPLAEMPGDLIAHVRYPEDLFKVQRQLLSRYHVTDAKSFYSGGDFWRVPLEPTQAVSASTPAQPPYYLTLKMPGQDEASFSLTTSYIPGGDTGRNIMTGFLAADGNAGNETGKIAESYGQMRLLETPRDLTVPGPGQAQNTMLTNPTVSTDLNLLRQGGTEVMQGNLLSLPVGDGLLYVQPVYVQASAGTQYPTLQYVLTLFGDQVGFAPTLDESLDQVFGGDSGVSAGDANIVGQKEAPVEGSTVDPDSEPTKEPEGQASKAPVKAPVAGTPQERLDTALQDAKTAVEASDKAMKDGDWAAYGKAQEELTAALEAAIEAQNEIDGE